MADRMRRERLFTFLLLPAIIVAVGVLTWFTFRTSFQLEKLREQSVVEATLSLANEKADRLDKLIIEQDDVVLAEVDVSDYQAMAARWLTVAARETPTVRAVLVINLARPMRDVVAFASRRPGPEDEKFRRLLVNSMIEDMDLSSPPPDQLRHLHKTYGGTNYLVSYWQKRHLNRRYLVVAWQDVPRIVHDLMPSLYTERDGKSTVNVVDEDDRIVFGPPLGSGEFTVGRPFATTLYKWRLNVTLTSAEELAANVERRRVLEIALVGASGLVVVAGLIVVLVAGWRERKLSNLKSDFVANVSHELKTPLSLVRMFGELLQSGRADTDAKRRQYLQIVVNESERLGALIENVLDFAKVERGKAAYEFAEGDVGAVVARAADACRPRAEREGIALHLAVADRLPPALIDERAIEIAVINLVDNAVKYAKDGGEVRVSVDHRDDSVRVSVADRGPGIAADDRKRIFDRFVRGRLATDRQVRGSGIGLALVKHIAEAHGGKVWVEDNAPRGSVFTITVRARLRPAAATTVAADAPEAAT